MAAKPGRGARVKGASFERKVASMLTEDTKVKFERGLGQTRRGGEEVSDVFSKDAPKWHFEAKRQIKCNIKAAMQQALNDVKETEKTPIVITKDDHGDILVTMRYEDWINLFKNNVKA